MDFYSADDIRNFFGTTADVTRSVAADVQAVRGIYDNAVYKSPRKDAQAIGLTQPGGEFEKNRAANAANTATALAQKSGSMNFGDLFRGPNSGIVTLLAIGLVAFVIMKAVK